MVLDYSRQRLKMVDGQIRPNDITNSAIIDAMLTTPREEFVPEQRRQLSYIDEDIEVAPARHDAYARYLMEPTPFAKLVQLAEIRPTDFVLDIGCATGYSAAILAQLAQSVVAIDSDPELVAQATEILAKLGHSNVAVMQAGAEEGYPSQAPYDVIVIQGGIDVAPESLFDQLKDGGRLVAVIGRGNSAQATLFVKDGDNVTGRRAFNAAIRPLNAFRGERSFQF